MAERDAMLAAILADPADDVRRLAFADWLEENGEGERAEFIRVQCEIAQLDAEEIDAVNDEVDWLQCTETSASWCPNCGDCSCKNREESMSDDGCPLHSGDSRHCWPSRIGWEQARLRATEHSLLCRHAYDWTDPLMRGRSHHVLGDCVRMPQSGVLEWEVTFRRGFIESVICTAEEWMEYADALFWHPEQTSQCPTCSLVPYSYPLDMHAAAFSSCKRCAGTDLVQRLFVPTAQPIREVTLTTWPGETMGWLCDPDLRRNGTVRYPAWPGVTFTMPDDAGRTLQHFDPS